MEADILALETQIAQAKYDQERHFGKLALNNDSVVALEAFIAELETRKHLLQDVRLAQSIDQALDTDQQVLQAMQSLNIQEERDHRLALLMSRSSSSVKLSKNSTDDSAKAGPSGIHRHPLTTVAECCSCFEKTPCVNSGKCKHYYCQDCIRGLFEASLGDRSLVPARCCKQRLPPEWASVYLKGENLQRYNVFIKETQQKWNMASLDKTYGQLVKALGGKQCNKCGMGITKKDGCNHMTCYVCRHEFCYVCGANWIPKRECGCDLFSEQEIERMLDEHPIARTDVVERERLRQVMQANEHHHQWQRHGIVSKNKRCKNGCDWVCNKWYYQCTTCRLNSCGRCTRNR